MQKVKRNPTEHILRYEIRKQLHGHFRVVEYRMCTDGIIRKRSIKKNLLYNDADELVYKLESKLK